MRNMSSIVLYYVCVCDLAIHLILARLHGTAFGVYVLVIESHSLRVLPISLFISVSGIAFVFVVNAHD